VADVSVVLAVQDTTELDVTGHGATSGLGPLRHGRERGLLAHSTLAVTPEGLPLGLLAQDVWARPEPGKTKGKRPLAERESQTWLTSLAAVSAERDTAPATQIVSVGEREADIYDLFLAERPPGVELLVRAQHDRSRAQCDGRAEAQSCSASHSCPDPQRRHASGRRPPPPGTTGPDRDPLGPHRSR